MRRPYLVAILFGLAAALLPLFASRAGADELSPGVRGLATRAPAEVKIDGDLAEFAGAFCTPVNYFHPDLANRAAQFFYMWDDEAFYAGLRTLDTKEANHSPDDKLWGGDAVEWYFDTRRGDDFRSKQWGPGAVHMYWTAYSADAMQPRWCLRPDMLKAIEGKGVEVAARDTKDGSEVEFKLPWANFPNFKPQVDEVIALDSELCYSDGAGRVDRTFAYGSPLSVQQPASQGMVQLVEKLEPAHWKQCGPVMMPLRCDTAWTQDTKALVTGRICLPPDHKEELGKIVFRISDLEGKKLGDYEVESVAILADNFYASEAHWPTDVAVPGAHTVVAIVHDKEGQELTRIAPRLVSAGWTQGY
jgi:hypothetical protein